MSTPSSLISPTILPLHLGVMDQPPPYSNTSTSTFVVQPTPRSASPENTILFHPSDPTASGSRRRSTQSSITTTTTPSTSSPSYNPSTAPTTPIQSRSWRPTPRVPSHIARRHRNDVEDRNRWLSEDEGLEGTSRPRRRRGSGGAGDLPPPPRRGEKQHRNSEDPKTRDRPKRSELQIPPRTGSSSYTSTPSVSALPEIANIMPPPSDVARVMPPTTSPRLDRKALQTLPDITQQRQVVPISHESSRKRAKRRQMLEKVRKLLTCVLCPSEEERILHHPLTLPCGHTLSSEHLYIPAPPPLNLPPGSPDHEIFAAQQRQHQQRLNLWSGVMCPIPTCKRYSPNVATGTVGDAAISAATSTLRSETLSSGVTYYPPAMPISVAPPAYTADAPHTETGSPLLDITVDKVMHLVLRELEEDDRRDPDIFIDDIDDEDEGHLSSHLTKDLSRLGHETGLTRVSSKRRKNTMSDPDTNPAKMTFEKEFLGLLECDVCSMMLYDPVTTPCQHSFCAKCMSRALDHSQRCPVCRQDLPSFAFFQDHAVNKVLLTILMTVFPDEYEERRAGIERDERDATLDTPIFVCTLAFPGMPTILHVFEPRYRLMIRRCIESQSPRFGMVLPARGNSAPHLQGLSEYGTMLEIQSVQMLPDGRSMVETVGTHRFKLLEKGSLDGYTVGRIEHIDDITPEEEIALEEEAVRTATFPALQTPDETMPPSTATDALLRAQLAIGEQSSPTPSTPIIPPHPNDINAALPSRLPTPLTSASSSTTSLPLPPNMNMPMVGPSMGLGIPGGATPGIPSSLVSAAPPDEAVQTTEEYMAICRAFIDHLRSGSAPWLLQRLNNTYGSMPSDPSSFSYWMALVMPIDEYEKARLLPIRSPRLRLKLIVHWVESLRSSWWFSSGCVVG